MWGFLSTVACGPSVGTSSMGSIAVKEILPDKITVDIDPQYKLAVEKDVKQYRGKQQLSCKQ